mgnify:FL=1
MNDQATNNVLESNTMNCCECNKVSTDKPWIIYKNEDGTLKNLCSYLCNRRCEGISQYNRKNIKNPEDFDEYRLFPILPKKEELKLLTLGEINRMNESQKEKYEAHLLRMFILNEENERLYAEHMEIENSYNEGILSTDEEDEEDY